jgi:hypothetical protein
MPSQLDVIAAWTVGLVSIAGVAALVKAVAFPDNPIPHKKRQELEEKYGHWAVSSAIAACPQDDIECVEREAKRLHQVRLYRR